MTQMSADGKLERVVVRREKVELKVATDQDQKLSKGKVTKGRTVSVRI